MRWRVTRGFEFYFLRDFEDPDHLLGPRLSDAEVELERRRRVEEAAKLEEVHPADSRSGWVWEEVTEDEYWEWIRTRNSLRAEED